MTKWALPALVLFAFPLAAEPPAEVAAPHVRVTYDGVTEPQARAIAGTLSAAREVYVSHFGFDMPETVRCSVECGAAQTGRLFTDGEDRVFLSLPSADKLLRPSKSGTFNLYGLCHELGHVAMYRILKRREWMTTAAAEGWAHYAGSVVVDEVYKAKGEELWTPDPYDYRADGTARLLRQLKEKQSSDVVKGAGQWQKLGAVVGNRGFRRVFEAWEKGSGATPDTPLAASQLSQAVAPPGAADADALTKWWAGAAPFLFTAPEASGFKKSVLDASRLERRPVKLGEDDGKPDGRRSIAGGGHARRFAAPGPGEWYLTTVSVHGARYGRAPAADLAFDVALCDAEMRPIATWKQPYRLFDAGAARWVRVEVPPTRVPPGDFYVVLDFRPTATQGVFVSIDGGTGGRGGSRVATPGKKGSELPQGDWMVRAELDRPKSADPLGR